MAADPPDNHARAARITVHDAIQVVAPARSICMGLRPRVNRATGSWIP